MNARSQVIVGDMRQVLQTVPANSVDAIVTDPPYGLAFMGKGWDAQVPGPEYWQEALRVAKPGAHLLAFGGTRTAHRLACAIEDAGWELRDCLSWLYGSGFPKSHDVSKAIDKGAGEVREVIGKRSIEGGAIRKGTAFADDGYEWKKELDITAPATPAAAQWQGWGTALKPAWEPIYLARKPLVGTVASNVLAYGCGGINVDGCRIGDEPITQHGRSGDSFGFTSPEQAGRSWTGRWPANLCLDESAAAMLGEPSRFFYVAKASRAEREQGLNGNGARANTHPTVKPIALMRWLVRLITPPGGIVLDPFAGSGSTGCAALLEGMRFLGIELQPDFQAIAEARMAHVEAA